MKTTSIHKYSFFNELSCSADYNFYGVIYDATIPTLEEPSNPNSFYEVSLKLIDPTTNPLCSPTSSSSSSNTFPYLTLIIRSNLRECMPYIHALGDIIRVHRGNYNPQKQTAYLLLTGITKIISSWCIFSGNPDTSDKIATPLICTGSNCLIEQQDLDILNEMRHWISLHFQMKGSLVCAGDVKLIERQTTCGNDSIVQIIGKSVKMEYTAYVVQDETDIVDVRANKYFSFCELGDVVRIVNYRVNQLKQIEITSNSNILIIPTTTECYKTLSEFISRKNNMKQVVKKEQNQLMHIPLEVKVYAKIDNYLIKVNISRYSKSEYCEWTQCDGVPQKNKMLIEVKVKELVYPKVFYDFKSVSNVDELNLVLLCVDRNDKEIIIHYNNYDEQSEGIFKAINDSDNMTINNKDEEIKQTIMKLINNDMYCLLMVEVHHFKLNKDNDTYINFASEKEGLIYRITGQYTWGV